MSDVSIGSGAALGIRRSTMAIRVGLMAVIAGLLYFVGLWSWAPLWWVAYAAMQLLILTVDRRYGAKGFKAIHGLYFISFTIAGAPTWHLWTGVPYAGNAAATMFLCGMIAQLTASSLAARSLFICSVTPLFAYLIVVPPLAIGAEHPIYAAAIVACALLFMLYLVIVWSGQQAVLTEFERSRADAQAASRAKSDFLASISHEIRTPMNAVMGATNLLARSELNPEQKANVAMLQDGSTVLMQLLNDLLDLSKIEAGKLTVEPAPVDLHAYIKRSAGFWGPRAEDAGLKLIIEIAPDVPRFVMLDAVRTGQVLFNLVGNAIKFTEDGEVKVEVSATVQGELARVRFKVSDTGIGMSREVMDRLFAPFEQAGAATSQRYGGTGLGLAICRKLTGLMEGELTVHSREGEGSTFTLELPLTLADCAATPTAEGGLGTETEEAPHTPLHILIAEDNPANQRVIELFLRPLGAELTIVGDGQQAVDALAERPFDVVLMDVRMPIMDGLEATRRIRASGGPNAEIPVLALTANVLEDQKRACEAAGMTGHIGKPIDARLLLSETVKAGMATKARRRAEKAA